MKIKKTLNYIQTLIAIITLANIILRIIESKFLIFLISEAPQASFYFYTDLTILALSSVLNFRHKRCGIWLNIIMAFRHFPYMHYLLTAKENLSVTIKLCSLLNCTLLIIGIAAVFLHLFEPKNQKTTLLKNLNTFKTGRLYITITKILATAAFIFAIALLLLSTTITNKTPLNLNNQSLMLFWGKIELSAIFLFWISYANSRIKNTSRMTIVRVENIIILIALTPSLLEVLNLQYQTTPSILTCTTLTIAAILWLTQIAEYISFNIIIHCFRTRLFELSSEKIKWSIYKRLIYWLAQCILIYLAIIQWTVVTTPPSSNLFTQFQNHATITINKITFESIKEN